MRVLVINGPNLNLLGRREPGVYGTTTHDDLEEMISRWAKDLGVEVEVVQTNGEERIIGLIQESSEDAILINPGAFTHTSRAISDAIQAVTIPVVEVHISNIREREPWRARSLIASACVRSIYGRGVVGYRDALRHVVNRAAMPFTTVRYGPHKDNVGDLRRGGGDLVVLVHGGLWRHEYERDTTESLAVDLATRGHDSWNLGYRRLGAGGGWPASGHDLLTALDHISRVQADAPVTAISHSAGSYLLMWAAHRSEAIVDRHVAMAPLLALEEAVAGDDVGADECRRMLQDGAPPLMTPGGVATTLVHGDDDEIVPVERSVGLAKRFGWELHRSRASHFSLLDPGKPEWLWIMDRIAST